MTETIFENDLFHISIDEMEEAGFMTYTAASHQGGRDDLASVSRETWVRAYLCSGKHGGENNSLRWHMK